MQKPQFSWYQSQKPERVIILIIPCRLQNEPHLDEDDRERHEPAKEARLHTAQIPRLTRTPQRTNVPSVLRTLATQLSTPPQPTTSRICLGIWFILIGCSKCSIVCFFCPKYLPT